MRNHLVAIIAIFLLGCSTKITMNQDDICVIIDENPRWSNSLLDAKKKWNAEPSTVMAIIRQESSFDPNAAPDREKVLGFIPWKRPSSAKGYSQAVEATWEQYQKETGNRGARRSNFDSSVDFIGWYLSKAPSARIRNYEVDKLYIAYHEGYGGFKKKTYRKKQWLIRVADRVQARSNMYQKQYWGCAKELNKKRFFFF